MAFCANCGTEIADILKFCPSCGAPANKDQDNKDMDSSDRQLDNQDHKQARKDRYQVLRNRVERYKPMWDKDGVIQFKSDHIAILQRKLGFNHVLINLCSLLQV
jgi:predicted amidophosphoribosyltransferase